MKKLVAMILTAAVVVSTCGVAVFANEMNPAVVQETTFTAPDPFVGEMSVTWYDAQGNEYTRTIRPLEETQPEISASATWSDGTNTYVMDSASHTVTVYDAAGNVCGVMPA